MPFGMGLTATAATGKLESNDPTVTVCDLSNNAVLQMKAPELMPKLAAALAKNTTCQELNLSGCGLMDATVVDLAKALETNQTLISLNLEGNKIGNDGATALATSLAKNKGVMVINLMGQKGTKFGDATLHAWTDMFSSNITLLKIIWRLESRQSFRLNKMVVRNNDINKRIKDGKDYAELLPTGVGPMSAALIEQRAEAEVTYLPTPRNSSRSMADDSEGNSGRFSARSFGGPAVTAASSFGSSRASDSERESPKPFEVKVPPTTAAAAAPKLSAPPALATPDPELEAKLTALEVEYEQEAAELKAKYAAKKAALIEAHSSASNGNGGAAEVS